MSEAEKQLLWSYHTRDDVEVARRIREGETDLITSSGWGLFDRFFLFLREVGFFDVLGGIEGENYQRRMVTLVRLISTYSVKVLLGIGSLLAVRELLFREVGLLKLLGFTGREIKEGICKRGKGKSRPMHQKILADMLRRLSEDEVNDIFNPTVARLSRLRFILEDTFIMDATDLETTERYPGCGMKVVRSKKWDRKRKEVVEIEELRYGYKLIMVQGVKSRIPVAAKVVKINEHESRYTLELIEQARTNLGSRGKIRLLLIDNAFMDGEDLWEIKKGMSIDFVTRARSSMNVVSDIRGMRDLPEGGGLTRGKRERLAVVGVVGLTTYDQYGPEGYKRRKGRKDFKGNPINAVMVTEYKGKVRARGKERVFLTSLPVKEPLKVYDKYDLRSLIENRGFRELKQGWKVGRFPAKASSVVRAHVMLTLTVYGLHAAYQTKRGEQLTQKGIRRIRREEIHDIHKVIVFAGEYFAILDIEEYSIVTRSPPRIFVRVDPEQVKTRLRLRD
jgi:hypothetical protein